MVTEASSTSSANGNFQREVATGQRFEFGRNWANFLELLDDDRIENATRFLQRRLNVERFDGLKFLDIGSGSGIYSLAARRLGAVVHSFDFDPNSVGCTQELKRRFFNNDPQWTIDRASVLDGSYLRSLGQFDVVYSWGVLHHTGAMWQALDNAASLVSPRGRLFIALYNDQGWRSRMWLKVKQIYCSGLFGRWWMIGVWVPYFFLRTCLVCLATRSNRFASFRRERGMSAFYDWIDWIGGLPFEVARPDDVVRFHESRGFQLQTLVSTTRLGNNEFVFQRTPVPPT